MKNKKKSDTKNKTSIFWAGEPTSVHFLTDEQELSNTANNLLNAGKNAIVIMSFSNSSNRLDLALAAHNKKDFDRYKKMVEKVIPTVNKLLKTNEITQAGKNKRNS